MMIGTNWAISCAMGEGSHPSTHVVWVSDLDPEGDRIRATWMSPSRDVAYVKTYRPAFSWNPRGCFSMFRVRPWLPPDDERLARTYPADPTGVIMGFHGREVAVLLASVLGEHGKCVGDAVRLAERMHEATCTVPVPTGNRAIYV